MARTIQIISHSSTPSFTNLNIDGSVLKSSKHSLIHIHDDSVTPAAGVSLLPSDCGLSVIVQVITNYVTLLGIQPLMTAAYDPTTGKIFFFEAKVASSGPFAGLVIGQLLPTDLAKGFDVFLMIFGD